MFISIEGRILRQNMTTRGLNFTMVSNSNNTNFMPQAHTPCFRYVISNNTLYRFNMTTNNYSEIYNFTWPHRYKIDIHLNRLIITTAQFAPRNVTWLNPATNQN